jgi:hypothetical protein
VYYVHDVFHGANGVHIVQQVLGKFGFLVPVFVIVKMFVELYMKKSSDLSYVFLIAVRSCEFIYAAFFNFTLMMVIFVCLFS